MLCERGRGGAHEVRVGPALGHVLGRGQAAATGIFACADVVGDGEQLEGGERARRSCRRASRSTSSWVLVLVPGRIAAGVGHDQLDLAAGQRVVPVLQERGRCPAPSGCRPRRAARSSRVSRPMRAGLFWAIDSGAGSSVSGQHRACRVLPGNSRRPILARHRRSPSPRGSVALGQPGARSSER